MTVPVPYWALLQTVVGTNTPGTSCSVNATLSPGTVSMLLVRGKQTTQGGGPSFFGPTAALSPQSVSIASGTAIGAGVAAFQTASGGNTTFSCSWSGGTADLLFQCAVMEFSFFGSRGLAFSAGGNGASISSFPSANWTLPSRLTTGEYGIVGAWSLYSATRTDLPTSATGTVVDLDHTTGWSAVYYNKQTPIGAVGSIGATFGGSSLYAMSGVSASILFAPITDSPYAAGRSAQTFVSEVASQF